MLRRLLPLLAIQLGLAKQLRSLQLEESARRPAIDPLCIDMPTASFPVDKNNDPEDCAWIQRHEKGDLCDLHRISSLCRVTCNICEETTTAIDLLKTCSDRPEPIAIPDMDTEVSCDWLRRNKAAHRSACQLTTVALHCPSSCGTFGLCVREMDENA